MISPSSTRVSGGGTEVHLTTILNEREATASRFRFLGQVYNAYMTPFEVLAFLMLGLIVLAIAGGMVALLWMAGSEQRAIARLASTPCPVCRQVLGKSSVNKGRLRAHESLQPTVDDEGSSPDHFNAVWWIVCPACDSGLVFDVTTRAWLKVQHPYRSE